MRTTWAAGLTSAEAIALIEAAGGPADLFGRDAARDYRRLAQLTHPDTHPGDGRAAAAFAKLAALWQRDIWLATRCMTELIGGFMPARMASFANGCLLASPRRRPGDAWRLLAELDELLERLYGPRKFRPFAVPA